jgi:hypothetical protein
VNVGKQRDRTEVHPSQVLSLRGMKPDVRPGSGRFGSRLSCWLSRLAREMNRIGPNVETYLQAIGDALCAIAKECGGRTRACVRDRDVEKSEPACKMFRGSNRDSDARCEVCRHNDQFGKLATTRSRPLSPSGHPIDDRPVPRGSAQASCRPGCGRKRTCEVVDNTMRPSGQCSMILPAT